MLQTNLMSKTEAIQAAGRRAAVLAPALVAALFGVLILWGIGFAGSSVIHNGAHDARHSHAFPCH